MVAVGRAGGGAAAAALELTPTSHSARTSFSVKPRSLLPRDKPVGPIQKASVASSGCSSERGVHEHDESSAPLPQEVQEYAE